MTARAQDAFGTAPRFWFLRHLERITYFFRQNLIDLGHYEADLILPLQEIRDLLPAAVAFADTQIPNQPLDRRRDLPSPSGLLLCLRMAREKPREPISRHALQPEPAGLPVSPQMRRNRRVTESLLGRLKCECQLCECVHVLGYYVLLDIYGESCALDNIGLSRQYAQV